MDVTDSVARRNPTPPWEVVTSDWEIELSQTSISVDGFDEAGLIGAKVVALLGRVSDAESVRDTQVTLRAWRVEATIAAPVGAWTSNSQRQLADAIGRLAA